MTQHPADRIVLDASVLVASLGDVGAIGALAREALRGQVDVHTSHLIDVDVTHALRGMVRRRALDAAGAGEILDAALMFPLTRWGMLGLMPRAWELRASVSAYDGAYVALAEVLDAELLTYDRRLERAAGPTCRIRVPG